MADDEKSVVGRRKLLLYGLGTATVGTAATIGVSEWRTRRAQVAQQSALESGHAILGFPNHAGVAAAPDAKPPRRRLGRTNLEVSVVGMGAGGLDGTGPIERAVDRGINYIDTSICYAGSEDVIGRAVGGNSALREKLVIATKWDAGAKTSKAEILDSLDKSLKRLHVDVIDIMQIHWLGGGHVKPDTGFDRLGNPELYAAMEEAKRAGKVRFFGATSHDANRSKILQHAIETGKFDMLLVKMNVLDFETAGIPELLAKAKEKDVGVVAMKSQPNNGAMPIGFEKSRLNIYQANLRWALERDIACVVQSSIGSNPEMQDLAIGAAMEKLGARDVDALERYAMALSPEYCRGCGDVCGAACPEGVAIAPVLQFGMYERHYGWGAYARRLYGALSEGERWSERCLTCDACTDACPYGVDAANRVRGARASLG